MNMVASIKKVFDYIVWVAFFGFLLLGVVIYVTNNTYPGDKFYPFKLKFEEFVLLTSKVLNKQIDFSIDLVSKRSYEVAKILSPNNSAETLGRLDTQVELTAASITQISDPVEKKKAAEEYIVKLNEASIILSEKEKELLGSSTTYSPTTNTGIQTTPQPTSSSSITEPTPTPTITIQVITQQPVTQPTVGPISEPTSTQAVDQPTIVPTAVPTTTPTTNIASTPDVSQQINNSQQTIQQAIIQMNNLATQDNRDFKKNKKPELPKAVKEGIKEKLNQEQE